MSAARLALPLEIDADVVLDGPVGPPSPRPGDRVALCEAIGGHVASAVVLTAGDDTWVVRLADRASTRDAAVLLRCLDAEGQAWAAAVALLRSDDDRDRVRVRRQGPWEPVASRGAARIPAAAPLVGDQDLIERGLVRRAVRTYRFSVLDVSGTGCRAAMVGSPPLVGADVRLGTGGSLPAPLAARVVRVADQAFGRTELGLVFTFPTPVQRAAVLAWRDSLVRPRR